jgi:putative glutamine amidotransferase
VSAHRPLIGITCGGTSGSPPRYAANQTYVNALQSAGAEAVLVPPGSSTALLERLDGLLLPGGPDLDPVRYGEDTDGSLPPYDQARDELELELLKRIWGVKPVLAICRGLQVANVAAGGSLIQHLDRHRQEGDRGALTEELRLLGSSRLREAVQADQVCVNSIHHQAAKVIGRGLRITAQSPDGLVEGLEDEAGTMVAVQCHPEELTRLDWSKRLFAQFVSRAAG